MRRFLRWTAAVAAALLMTGRGGSSGGGGNGKGREGDEGRGTSAAPPPAPGADLPASPRPAGATARPGPGQFDHPQVSAPGAAPILLVDDTGDPATPYEGTHRMADGPGQGLGVELTGKGEGHGAYGNGSDCVDSMVNACLLDGRQSVTGTRKSGFCDVRGW